MYKLKNWVSEDMLTSRLSVNPRAIDYLEKNPDKIDWFYLSLNPAAIPLLQENPDKIDWTWLSANTSALQLLEENQLKIDWWELSKNPEIFEYDYKAMSRPFTEELIATVYHPDNFKKLI